MTFSATLGINQTAASLIVTVAEFWVTEKASVPDLLCVTGNCFLGHVTLHGSVQLLPSYKRGTWCPHSHLDKIPVSSFPAQRFSFHLTCFSNSNSPFFEANHGIKVTLQWVAWDYTLAILLGVQEFLSQALIRRLLKSPFLYSFWQVVTHFIMENLNLKVLCSRMSPHTSISQVQWLPAKSWPILCLYSLLATPPTRTHTHWITVTRIPDTHHSLCKCFSVCF